MTAAASPNMEFKRQLRLVLAIWVVISAWMIFSAMPSIRDWTFSDPDDAMRLVQVRDWLAGQSWFDVTQYRLSAPAGAPMHWSRLVDLPIAAVILIARPFLGQHGAETAALVAVPLLTLGVAMVLVHRIAFKLMGSSAALFAVLATPFSLGAMKQMRILRIDHHGWQIVLALAAMLAVLDQRARRSGVLAGVAMALWLNISIEALPFVAAIGAWFALQWAMDSAAGERLKAFLASLAVASASLLAITHLPSLWFAHPHDILNIAHLAGFAVAAAGAYAAVRPSIAGVRARLAVLAGIGTISLAAMFAVDPHFLQGPFSSLDPLVRAFWYVDVDEGLPIWRLEPSVAATGLAQPLVGLAAGLFAAWKCAAEQRRGWIAYSYMMFAMTLASMFVIREATTASVMSLPATAFLCDFALRRARNVSLMPLRVAGTTGAVLIMAPAYAAPALVVPADPRLITAMHSSHDCVTRDQLERLDQLPLSDLAVPLDMTPAVLASTRQRAIASGYHRNNDGIHDVILAFVAPLPTAKAVMAKRHITYVVFCPNTPEAIRWSHRGPQGLAAALNAGRAPGWLTPVEIPGLKALRVWKVTGASRA